MVLGLSGCWLSQEPLFTPADYAEVDLNGRVYNTMDRDRPVGVGQEVVSVDPDLVPQLWFCRFHAGRTEVLGLLKSVSASYAQAHARRM